MDKLDMVYCEGPKCTERFWTLGRKRFCSGRCRVAAHRAYHAPARKVERLRQELRRAYAEVAWLERELTEAEIEFRRVRGFRYKPGE